MAEVRRVVESEQIRGPRQLGQRLREIRVKAPTTNPLLAEFVRSVLLNGNGTLLLNNTFVQWAATQAFRRARPVAAAIVFGVRNRVKPFSSLLIYADQEQATPIPSQMDTLGSYVDLEIFINICTGSVKSTPNTAIIRCTYSLAKAWTRCW
jgi:hypothetical protein